MDEYLRFVDDFYKFSGINLNHYKRPQMERRLTALVHKHGYTRFQDFLMDCRKNPVLLADLLNKMTINVSEFFRNPERWEQLVDLLTTLHPHQNKLSIWSAACATGEEPYSLAILLEEQVKRPYDIVASDIDDNVLAAAKLALYKEHQIKSVPAHLKERCFEQGEGVRRLQPKYQQHILFQHHNLLEDTYPAGFDLIVCRNVLIYFTEQAKKHVLQGFAASLKPSGVLFVGSTEQIFSPQDYALKQVKPFLYQKTL